MGVYSFQVRSAFGEHESARESLREADMHRVSWLCGVVFAVTLSSCEEKKRPAPRDAAISTTADAGCTPVTCAAEQSDCGVIDDGCGNLVDCGSCTLPLSCGGDGCAGRCGCTPVTCAPGQNECGMIPDGCGSVLDCGLCPAGQTCGAAAPNRCGIGPCVPKTCPELGAACGPIPDGCSGTIDCGDCMPPLSCHGSGVANQCGCTPKTCQPGLDCKVIPDGCGQMIDCGNPCVVPKVCNPESHTCCLPVPCPDGTECQTLPDGCGSTIQCGDCTGW